MDESGVEIYRRTKWQRLLAYCLMGIVPVCVAGQLLTDGVPKTTNGLIILISAGVIAWGFVGGIGLFVLTDWKASYVKLSPEGVEVYDKMILPKFIAYEEIKRVGFGKNRYGRESRLYGAEIYVRGQLEPYVAACFPPTTRGYRRLVNLINERAREAQEQAERGQD